jgi:hypothetical protein
MARWLGDPSGSLSNSWALLLSGGCPGQILPTLDFRLCSPSTGLKATYLALQRNRALHSPGDSGQDIARITGRFYSLEPVGSLCIGRCALGEVWRQGELKARCL